MTQIFKSRILGGTALLGAVLAVTSLSGCKEKVSKVAVGTSPECDQPTTPFCNSSVPFPDGWTGHKFTLAQDYPKELGPQIFPWTKVDPKANPGAYTQAVLDYFYEGNIRESVEDSFDPALNTVRGWYNAPWQNVGANGREPLHGLTRERPNQPFELDPNQKQVWNNYAVGFYNPPGGKMIGQVWANHGKPDATLSTAPEGTVAAKLLFTTASDEEVPWMKGSPGWDAYVFEDLHNGGSFNDDAPRKVTKVRLLQLDIAVKDKRSAQTGWFFGTFVYGGGMAANAGSGWKNVAPVGLMWGNDPGYSGTGPLKETWINPAVKLPHLGYQGRLNGPVDNPKSSCLSCHATAQSPESIDDLVNNLLPPPGVDPTPWFQNIYSGKPFTPGKISNDYSMNLAFGLASFASVQAANKTSDPTARKAAQDALIVKSSAPPRGGHVQ